MCQSSKLTFTSFEAADILRFTMGTLSLYFGIRFLSMDGCRGVNWYSVDKQLESVKAILDFDFLHIFPGHGRQHHFDSLDDRLRQFDHLLTKEGVAGVL